MKLDARRRRLVEDPELSPDVRALRRCALAQELEEAGEYEAAAEALGGLWRGVGQRPRVERLDGRPAAEVLLHAGALTGWLGSGSGTEGAQESAKDLLSESAALFESLRDTEKVAEARIELACCYWREGAFDEARVVLRGVVDSQAAGHPRQRAVALLRLAIVAASDSRYSEALDLLAEASPLFEREASHSLRGKFHNERANALNYLYQQVRREEYLDRALIEYTAAAYHFQRASHTRNQAAVENNLGVLYVNAGRYEEARAHLTSARRLFGRLKDRARVAQVDETRARLHLAEGALEEAEQAARAAVRALERGDELAVLGESLVTHATALARLGRAVPAQASFERAADVLLRAGSSEGAGTALLQGIQELRARLPVGELAAFYERADGLFGQAARSDELLLLRRAAREVFAALRREEGAEQGTEEGAGEARADEVGPALGEGFSLREEVRRLEARYIALALREAGGKVSRAAKLLGFEDHGSLNALLKNRHTELLSARLPKVPRRRSILKKRR